MRTATRLMSDDDDALMNDDELQAAGAMMGRDERAYENSYAADE